MTGDDDTPANSGDEDGALPPEGIADAGSADGVRRARTKTAKQAERRVEFWRGILADPVGREEIWAFLASCNTFEPRFACGPTGFPQPEATWFHAGEQATGQRLYQSLLLMDMEQVRQMHIDFDPRFPKVKK